MKAVSFNARSICNKLDEFKAVVYHENYDLIAITETWCDFKNRDSIALFRINGYRFYYRDRIDRVGGGVIVYVKSIYSTTEIKINNIAGIDIVGVAIDTGKIKLNIFNVYRPPGTGPDIDVTLYTELSRFKNDYSIFLGDFNCPHYNHNLLDRNAEGKRLLKFIEDNFLYQLIDCPTRGNNILDLLIVTHQNLISNFEITQPIGRSDHNMIKFTINVENRVPHNCLKIPDFNNANFEGLGDSLSIIDWDLSLTGNANEMWNKFLVTFKQNEEVFVRYKTKRLTPNSKPKWWSTDIGSSLTNRNRAYKLSKSSPSAENITNYVNLRRQCKRLIRQHKRNFEINIARECKHNPKMFYSYVNNKNAVKDSVGPILDVNGTLKSNNKEIADILNDFFVSVFTKENLEELPSMNDIIEFNSDNILDQFEVPEEEVASQLRNHQAQTAFTQGI